MTTFIQNHPYIDGFAVAALVVLVGWIGIRISYEEWDED